MKISVVTPVYNEAANIEAHYNELKKTLSQAGLVHEIIYVDDGSSDASLQILKEIARDNNNVKLISFRRNFGQTAAMSAGFDMSTGDVVIPIDADLQNDPKDIPRLLEKISEGYDVVSGWRKDRKDKFISRRLPSVIANAIISRMTNVHLHDYGCSLKAYRKEVVSHLNLYGELHRFVPALASLVGAKVVEIPVNHRSRMAGVSKYGIDRTLRVVLDLITVKFLLKYATRPMQLLGKWGVLSLLMAFFAASATIYMKFAEGFSMNRNPLLILTTLLVFVGIQFLGMGLLGELVTRTYYESQDKKVYNVKEMINFEQ